MELNITICGDCIEKMQDIKDGSVDLVVADPPYWKVVGEKWDYQWRTENDYVELMDINFSEKKESIYVRLYAKKRKNGFLDGGLAMPAPLDGPFYF